MGNAAAPGEGPPPGDLAALARARSARARETGALHPIATRNVVVPEAGIPFCVRLAPGLAERARVAAPRGGERASPFLPWEEALFVAELSPTHAAILNKFPVLEGHLLLVTRAFEPQESPLTLADFEALYRVLSRTEGVGFYNGGARAGASQRHKHLQVVPAPVGAGPERAPLESVLEAARPDEGAEPGVCVLPALPFRHALARLDAPPESSPESAAAAARAAWEACRRALALDARPRPYNLVATREGLLAVPRSRAAVEGIPVNALAYAGALLATREADVERVRREGPLAILARAGEPAAREALSRPAAGPPR